MKKIVITGATSMIGVAVIKEAIKHDVEVLAIVRRNSTRISRLPKSDKVKIYECNLDEIADANINGNYDVFYHFAWSNTEKTYRDNPILQENNIKYTLDAVKLAHDLGCCKFIGAGSQAEYGKIVGIITEDTSVNPIMSYGIAKYCAGLLSKKLCNKYGITHIWGRIFSVYGINDNDGTMLSYAIRSFINGKVAKFSSGTQIWNYLFEDDVGKIFYLLGRCVNNDKILCIANKESKRLKEYIEEIINCCKSEYNLEPKYIFDKSLDKDAINLNVCIDNLLQEINYTPEIEFRKGIKIMISSYIKRNNRK